MSQLAPHGSAACLGAFRKMSGIDRRRFLRSPHPLPLPLFFRTPLRTVSFPSCKFSETPATQATGEANKQPLICRSPLFEIAQNFRLVRCVLDLFIGVLISPFRFSKTSHDLYNLGFFQLFFDDVVKVNVETYISTLSNQNEHYNTRDFLLCFSS